MQVGELMYVGSMGAKFNHCGFPVLIISVSKKHNTCYGLINGEIRWYTTECLKREAKNGD